MLGKQIGCIPNDEQFFFKAAIVSTLRMRKNIIIKIAKIVSVKDRKSC